MLELDVEVRIFHSSANDCAAGDFSHKVVACKVRLDGPLPETGYMPSAKLFAKCSDML